MWQMLALNYDRINKGKKNEKRKERLYQIRSKLSMFKSLYKIKTIPNKHF